MVYPLEPPFWDSASLSSFVSCFMITTLVTLPLQLCFPRQSVQPHSAWAALGQVLAPVPMSRTWRKGHANWLEYNRTHPWSWAGGQSHVNHIEACAVCQISSAFCCPYGAYCFIREADKQISKWIPDMK